MGKEKIALYNKMHNIMTAVTFLQKDDRVKFGNTDYKVITEEKVTTELRKQLINEKLIIVPTDIDIDYEVAKGLTTINATYKIIDIETGEHEILKSCGQGSDSQDKGTGKAMTYAFKYLLLRIFAIPTGEDPDKIASAETDDKQAKQAKNTEETIKQTLITKILKIMQLEDYIDYTNSDQKIWLEDKMKDPKLTVKELKDIESRITAAIKKAKVEIY